MIKSVLSKLLSFRMDNSDLDDVNEIPHVELSQVDEVDNRFNDEYKLLVSRGRVIDYTHANAAYNLDIKVGMYNDTYLNLTKDLDEDTAKLNVFKVLSSVSHFYDQMTSRIKEKTEQEKKLNKDYTSPFGRTQRPFLVRDLELANGAMENIYCINLLTRPDIPPFVIIGLKPKGKLRTVLGDKDKIKNWKK